MFCYGVYCWYQSVFIFFTGRCDSYQGRYVCSLPLWVVKLKIRSMSLSSSSRSLRNAFFPGQLAQRCIIHSQFDGSHTTLLTRSLYVTSHFRASTNKMLFWWVVETHTNMCSWWTCNGKPFRMESAKLGESNFHIWVSFFKCSKPFMETVQSWLLLFVNTFLDASIILYPGKLPAVFIILIESMNKINYFLGNLL